MSVHLRENLFPYAKKGQPGKWEFAQLAKKELKLPVRIGKPRGILNLDDPIWSVSCGLILGGLNLEAGGKEQFPGIRGGIGNKIKKIFKIFIP